ncbi:MBL fold metallo-hydrolase [Acidilobus sp.]|jgi:glyoxylase-like metal-dependent hydrolase (beta-lactamase superfamily II)|uniref:MBL fold metallo-hydrolase n=1 Tax=Acidilobus sp. TaxID=1872109 RepID=UPI003CFDB549
MEVFHVKGVSNSYLTSDGVLIDAGARASDVARVAEEHGVKVRYLLITHQHVDHVRYAAEIVKAFNCRVVAPSLEADVIEGRARPSGSALTALFQALLRARAVHIDVRVNEGDVIEGYGAVLAPGHTPGSTAYVKDEVMFSGDAIVSRNGRPSLPSRALNVNHALAEESLRRLLELRPRVIYPGHGKPIKL